MRQIAGLLLVSLIQPVQAEAASFDCSRAATRVEKMICANEELSKLDEALSESYKKSFQRTDIKSKTIIKSQRLWLKNVRNRCHTIDCVKAAYETRIREIGLMYSFGIVIHNMPPAKKTTSADRVSKSAQSQGIPAVPPGAEAIKMKATPAIQPCPLPEVQDAEKEEGALRLIEAVKEEVAQKQYECVVQGMEQARGLVQSMPAGAKRAGWGFDLKDVVLTLIRSNELPGDEYEYRLIRVATQSLNDDWSPDMQASEDERLNDAAFLGGVSDHYRSESQKGAVQNRPAVYNKLYLVDLAMLRMNFTLPPKRRPAEPWRIENFFNDTNRTVYLDDVYKLWSGLPQEDRGSYQKKLAQGILKATAGHVMSGYDLLPAESASRNIEVVNNLLAYIPQEPVGWQTYLYLAEAYWQAGDKKMAHDYFEKSRAMQAPYISSGSHLFSMARYLCSRMENGKLIRRCPFGIYSRDEMKALLDDLEGMAETDSLVKYKIDNVRAMRSALDNGAVQ